MTIGGRAGRGVARWAASALSLLVVGSSFAALADESPPPDELAALPLVEVPARAGTTSDLLAVIVSGDGGWTALPSEVADAFAAEGIPVVGLNSLKYFWTRRTPEQAASALAAVLRHYQASWARARFLLVGYSLGADVLPFMVNRLPAELRDRVAGVALLSPSHRVDFEFHVGQWFGGGARKTDLPVAPEVARLSGFKVVCLHGEDEKDTLCPELAPGTVTGITLPGAHHFGGDYGTLAARLLAELR